MPRAIVIEMLENYQVLLTFGKVRNPLRLPRFFDISTSKSASGMVRVDACCTFWLRYMCFTPQRRALFRHLNFQKCSENGVLCACSLRNVLRATTPCTFSTSQLPKVLREWCVLYMLTSKCASCHNSAQVFISHLARWLRTCRFSEPTFRPSEPQIMGKTDWIATFLPFRAHASSFLWLFLFSDLLSSSLLFTDSFHLCFSICPYCQKFDF